MNFSLLVEFAETQAENFIYLFSGEGAGWEMLLMSIPRLIELFIEGNLFFNYIDLPDWFISGLENVFSTNSIATILFTALPITVIVATIIHLILDIIL